MGRIGIQWLLGARLSTVMIALAVVISSCKDQSVPPVPGSSPPPRILSQEVGDNPNNVLSAVVHVMWENASALTVELTNDEGQRHSTPCFPTTGNPAQLPLLGLTEKTTYTCRVIAFSADGRIASGETFEIVTGTLPDDLPRMSAVQNPGVTPGYVLLSMPSASVQGRFYALIVDNAGEVKWYRTLSNLILDFQKQDDGSYTVFSSHDGATPRFLQMDNLGDVQEEYRSQVFPETGPHELRLRQDGYCLFGVEYRLMDLTAIGGQSNARVRGLSVEYHRNAGVSLVWNTFDHFAVGDALPDIPVTGPDVNPWHGNAIEVDTDGHLLVSFRSLGEITKINSTTGEIIWRLGGRNNQFTIIADPLNGFTHQHGIRRLPNGNVILFDNGGLHSPPASRAVEYRLDEHSRTAELVWEFRPAPPIFSPFLGFAQRLENGHTLVCFGRSQRVIEVDANGSVVWELHVDEPGKYPYRAIRVASLY